MSGLKTRLPTGVRHDVGPLFPDGIRHRPVLKDVVMQFRNEERTHKALCWVMDISLLIMVGWIIGLIADMIRLS